MSFVRDAACLSGAGLALWGLYLIHAPLAYIAAGVMVCAGSVFWSMRAVK